MYHVLRCPGCATFSYADRFERWKLCHVCGEVINVKCVPHYLDVRDYRDAEEVVNQLEDYLYISGRKDLSQTELLTLRREYSTWLRLQNAEPPSP